MNGPFRWKLYYFTKLPLRMVRSVGRLALPLTSVALLAILFFLSFRTFGQPGVGPLPVRPIQEFTNWIVPLLISASALGFAVMAIIQLFKPELRVSFHSRQLEYWLHGGPVHLLLEFVSPKAGNALLELPIEQLAAQIQASADAALAIKSPRSDMFLELVLGPGVLREEPFIQIRDEPKQQGRIAYIIQRRLDDLQIQVKREWRSVLRTLCLSVALLLTSLVAGILGLWQIQLVGTGFLVLLFSLVGAFFASVARDLIAIVERLRN